MLESENVAVDHKEICTHHTEETCGCCKRCPSCGQLIYHRHLQSHITACYSNSRSLYEDGSMMAP